MHFANLVSALEHFSPSPLALQQGSSVLVGNGMERWPDVFRSSIYSRAEWKATDTSIRLAYEWERDQTKTRGVIHDRIGPAPESSFLELDLYSTMHTTAWGTLLLARCLLACLSLSSSSEGYRPPLSGMLGLLFERECDTYSTQRAKV